MGVGERSFTNSFSSTVIPSMICGDPSPTTTVTLVDHAGPVGVGRSWGVAPHVQLLMVLKTKKVYDPFLEVELLLEVLCFVPLVVIRVRLCCQVSLGSRIACLKNFYACGVRGLV